MSKVALKPAAAKKAVSSDLAIEAAEMEARLNELKQAMAAERARREQIIASNPTATIWRSAAPKTLRTASGNAATKPPAPPATNILAAAAAASAAAGNSRGSVQPSAEPTPRNHDSNSSANDDDDSGYSSGYGTGTGGGGGLLDGEYDEGANRQSFLEALNEWRRGGSAIADSQAAAAQAAPASSTGGRSYFERLALQKASSAAGAAAAQRDTSPLKARRAAGDASASVSGRQEGGMGMGMGGAGSGGAMLSGAQFDEDESRASFLEALNEWRSGGAAKPAPSRPAARPQSAMAGAQTDGGRSRPVSAVQQPSKLSYFERVRLRNASAAAGFKAAKVEVPLPPPRPPSALPHPSTPAAATAATPFDPSNPFDEPGPSSSSAAAGASRRGGSGVPGTVSDIDAMLDRLEDAEREQEAMQRSQLARLDGDDADGGMKLLDSPGKVMLTAKSRLPDNVRLPSAAAARS